MLGSSHFASTATLLVESELRRLQVPGAIVMVDQSERGTYSAGVGVADTVTGEPIAVESHVRAGSITKTFTATAILLLVDDGALHLDDPVGNFLPEVPNGSTVTVRQLLNMTSGLPDYVTADDFLSAVVSEPHRAWTPEELLAVAFAQPRSTAAGIKWEYSSTNTILLGLIVEGLTGRPLHEVLADRIFAPLGMHQTQLPLRTDNKLPDPHPHGYTPLSPGDPMVDSTDWNPSWGWAAGSATSTVKDLAVWARAMATGQLLDKRTYAERLDWVTTESDLDFGTGTTRYGLGIADFGGLIGHNGSLPGFQAIAAYQPQHQLTVVVVANAMEAPVAAVAGAAQPADAIAFALASLVNQTT